MTEPIDGEERLTADEARRLRRHLRALSAVNRQLYDQLESGGRRVVDGAHEPDLLDVGDDAAPQSAQLSLRRAGSGTVWVEQLQLRGGATEPYLVRAPRGAFLIDGRMRRPIKAGLIFGALERIAPVREIADADLDALEEGPPVEVLEGPSGPAFVVVGGRRYPLRGLPLPYPVTADEMTLFPEAQELRVGVATPPGTTDRARAVFEREGAVRGTATVARKSVRRVWRKVSPKRS